MAGSCAGSSRTRFTVNGRPSSRGLAAFVQYTNIPRSSIATSDSVHHLCGAYSVILSAAKVHRRRRRARPPPAAASYVANRIKRILCGRPPYAGPGIPCDTAIRVRRSHARTGRARPSSILYVTTTIVVIVIGKRAGTRTIDNSHAARLL